MSDEKDNAKARTKQVLTGDEAPKSLFALRKKTVSILSEEAARDQVLDFAEYYDIDVERIDDKGARQMLEGYLGNLTRYVQRGALEVARDKDQKMVITLNLSDGKTSIEFCELGARHKLVMDNRGVPLLCSAPGASGTDNLQALQDNQLSQPQGITRGFSPATDKIGEV